MFRSWDIQFRYRLKHSINCGNCDFVELHFWVCLLNQKSFGLKIQSAYRYNHQIINRSHCFIILSLSEKNLELVPSLHNWAKKKKKKKQEVFLISYTIIWPNLILILPRILQKQSKVQVIICKSVCRFIMNNTNT